MIGYVGHMGERRARAGLIAVASLAALAVAAAVVALPTRFALALLAGCGTFAFGQYVLRERGALRGLFRAVDRAAGRSDEVQRQLAQDRDEYQTQLRQTADRFEDLAKELAGLNAAVTNEILHPSRGQPATSERIEELLADTAGVTSERLGSLLADVPTQTELRRLDREALAAASRDFRQLEALSGLYALFHVRAPVPPSRKWAASPDLLLFLTSLVLERRPRLLLEIGSGLSTLWLAYALEKSDHGGRIISLDHDAGFAERTRSMLKLHGLSSLADVRDAPLVDTELVGETWPWYDQAALVDIDGCDFVFVDGPPGATRERARYPALPVVHQRLAPHAMVVLDDCIRQDERDIVQQWRREYPEWMVEMLDHEKVTAVLSRR